MTITSGNTAGYFPGDVINVEDHGLFIIRSTTPTSMVVAPLSWWRCLIYRLFGWKHTAKRQWLLWFYRGWYCALKFREWLRCR